MMLASWVVNWTVGPFLMRFPGGHGLTEIGPVIALRRRTDYQFSPNWLSGDVIVASVQMRSRFAIIGRSVAGKAIGHSATRCRRVVDLHKPGQLGLGYDFPGCKPGET